MMAGLLVSDIARDLMNPSHQEHVGRILTALEEIGFKSVAKHSLTFLEMYPPVRHSSSGPVLFGLVTVSPDDFVQETTAWVRELFATGSLGAKKVRAFVQSLLSWAAMVNQGREMARLVTEIARTSRAEGKLFAEMVKDSLNAMWARNQFGADIVKNLLSQIDAAKGTCEH